MNSPDRLREHPEDRLASPTQFVDLAAAGTALRAEPHAAVGGHRQVTVARHGPVTVILFAFEHDGLLKEHHADGEVLLQVLQGRLQVTADEDTHTMGPGTLLALAPGLAHSVRALEATDMLLTVHRLPVDAGAA
jgi:quercetin dioxygenase-like cupin family protein